MAGVEGHLRLHGGPGHVPAAVLGHRARRVRHELPRLWGDTAEFLAAIEDVVADQADALNISLGHSYWLMTDPDHDPVRKALDAAVDAGARRGRLVRKCRRERRIEQHRLLEAEPGGHHRGQQFGMGGSSRTRSASPAPVRRRSRCSGVRAWRPWRRHPADRVDDLGRVRGRARRQSRKRGRGLYAAGAREHDRQDRAGRSWDVHVRRQEDDMAAGAKAWIVHNNTPDAPTALTAASPRRRFRGSWSRSRTVARSSPGPLRTPPRRSTSKDPPKRLTSGWPDVVSGTSSRGPGPNLELKPDITAPGSSILSSVVNDTTGAVAAPLFDLMSGTSMAAPHIAALAALTEARHPGWKPGTDQGALMNTASTAMWTDIDHHGPGARQGPRRRPGRRRTAGRPAAHVRSPQCIVRLMRPTDARGA